MLAAEPQDWDPSYRSYQQSQRQKAKSSFSIPVPSAAVLGGASLVLVCLVGYFAVPVLSPHSSLTAQEILTSVWNQPSTKRLLSRSCVDFLEPRPSQ
jgi:hypothetical protein